MLDLAGYTASDIDFRMYRYAGLTDLPVMVNEACIHSGTARADLSVQFFRELEELIKALFTAHSVTSGYYYRRTFEVMLGSLDVAVDNLYDEVCRVSVLTCIGVNNLVLSLTVIQCLLHNAAADGCHLGSVVWVDDCRHDVTAKSGTYLVKKVVVMLACLLVVIVSDFKLSAVCGKSAGERRRNARAQIAAYYGSTHKANLRLFLLEEVYQD